MLNEITQFYLPLKRFLPARAEQGLEHFIRNELVNVASHFTDLGRMEPESSYLPGSGVEPLQCMIEHAFESVR